MENLNTPKHEIDRKPDEPFQPFSCHLQRNDGRPLMADAHWHYRIEILYGIGGDATVLLGGQVYPFGEGDMILISAREVHAVWGSPGTEYFVIKFDPEIFYTAALSVFESRVILPFTMARESPQKIFHRHEIEATAVPDIVMAIRRESEEQSFGYELAIRTHISQLFLWILRTWHDKGLRMKSGERMSDKDQKRLQNIFDQVDRSYMQNLTAKDMARQHGMSYSYFSRHFKSVFGMSFTAYLNFIRLVEAEKLLLSTGRTITEIAMETGFSSDSYFISQFRKSKSNSPGQYRRKMSTKIHQTAVE